jgi:hypothetical protein
VIEKRRLDRYPRIAGSYETFGIPRDMGAALALFERSPFDFERWVVSRKRPAQRESAPLKKPSTPPAPSASPGSATNQNCTEGLDHYAVAMKDPEGNEFDVN